MALLRRVDELAADGLRDEESWIGVKSKVLYRVVWYVVPTLVVAHVHTSCRCTGERNLSLLTRQKGEQYL